MLQQIGQSVLSTIYSNQCSTTTQMIVGGTLCISSTLYLAYRIKTFFTLFIEERQRERDRENFSINEAFRKLYLCTFVVLDLVAIYTFAGPAIRGATLFIGLIPSGIWGAVNMYKKWQLDKAEEEARRNQTCVIQ